MLHHVTDGLNNDCTKSSRVLSTENFLKLCDKYVFEDIKIKTKGNFLTFDDGLADFYNTVFPIISERQIPVILIVVQTVAVLPREIHPVTEVLNGQIVTGILALGIHAVEVDLVLEGGEGEGHLDVGSQLVTGLGGIGVAARDQILGLHVAQALKADYVVTLPAVEGHRDLVELLQRLVGVDAVLGVLVTGVLIGFDDLVLIHGGIPFLGGFLLLLL